MFKRLEKVSWECNRREIYESRPVFIGKLFIVTCVTIKDLVPDTFIRVLEYDRIGGLKWEVNLEKVDDSYFTSDQSILSMLTDEELAEWYKSCMNKEFVKGTKSGKAEIRKEFKTLLNL